MRRINTRDRLISVVVRVLHGLFAQMDAGGLALSRSRETSGRTEELQGVQRRVEMPAGVEHEPVEEVSRVVDGCCEGRQLSTFRSFALGTMLLAERSYVDMLFARRRARKVRDAKR